MIYLSILLNNSSASKTYDLHISASKLFNAFAPCAPIVSALLKTGFSLDFINKAMESKVIFCGNRQHYPDAVDRV